jgi:hypothetical protein
MRTARLMLLAIAIAIALGACATTRTASVDALIPLQTHSSYYPLFYVGSDDQYHYFNYLKLKYWKRYRVLRPELSMEPLFARNSGKYEVVVPGTLERARQLAESPNKSTERTR